MENIIICSKSELSLSGIYYKIYTNVNNVYTYIVNANFKKGDLAYVYCEDNKQTKLISRKNILTKGETKEYKFKVKGINDYINFGILFANKNTEYELDVKYIEISSEGKVLNNIENINLYRKAFIIYNKQKITNNEFLRNYNKNNFEKLILVNKIKQLYVSSIVNHFKKLINIYNLSENINNKEPVIVIGLYKNSDYKFIKDHKGIKYIIWQNKNIKIKNFEELVKNLYTDKTIKHYCDNKQSKELLKKYNIDAINIDFNVRQLLNISYSNKIFVYNGIEKDKENDYGKNIYEKVRNRLYDYEFIYSNESNLPKERMHELYINCISAIILCNENVNENINELVYGLNSLNITTICNKNIDSNTKWNTVADIEMLVRYRNIYLFNKELRKYKNILFLCTDYPSWGGAATNTYELIKWYNKNTKHKTFGIFFHDTDIKMEDANIHIQNINTYNPKEVNEISRKYFKGEPDLLILRNYIDPKILKQFECKKYFLIPGIFRQNLTKYSKLLSHEDIDLYINKHVMNTIKKCDKLFTNSFETKKILEKYYKIESEILHFNYLPYYGVFNNFNKDEWLTRKYDIAVIVSDFSRKIKNIKLINKVYGALSNYKKLVIGNNNNKIIGDNTDRHNLLDHKSVLELYPNIKYVINTSYYESCSNVLVEAKYRGCKILFINDENYKETIKHIESNLKRNVFEESISITGESLNLIQKPNNNIQTLNKNSKEILESPETLESNNFSLKIDNLLEEENPIKVEIIGDNDKIIVKLVENTCEKKKILIISTQYPFYGGAATLAYKIHEKILKSGYKSYCLFLHNKPDCNYNPYKINNVFLGSLCKDYKNKESCEIYYECITKIVSKPDIIIGLNYISPIIGKFIYPESKVYYYITGNRYISKSNLSAIEYLNSTKRSLEEIDEDELYCMNICDHIIPNSDLTQNIFMKMYPEYSNKYTKIIEFESLFIDEQLNNKNDKTDITTVNEVYEKIHDVVVISSRFNRNVKNIDLINNIFNNLKKENKACVGEKSEEYVKEANIHYGFRSHDETLEILRKSKILLITSKYESYSVTLLDGIKSDCIILSNINVAASRYLNDYFIVENDSTETWIKKINDILNNYKYFKSIFKCGRPSINLLDTIDYLIAKDYTLRKKNVVFVSVDKPFRGGCSTNTYNMIKSLQNCREVNPIGIFISNEENENGVNPYNLDQIYHVSYNDKIENNLKTTIRNIQKKIDKIDTYFIKNYKAYICIKWVNKNKKCNIIFSPSGLRSLGIQKNKYNDITNILNKNLGLYEFINTYDKNLENYIYNKCECIIPNSSLTFNIINSVYDVGFNLKHPCNITYIDYEQTKCEDKIRNYDIAFMCYSWKRKIKNYEIVKQIIENKKMTKYKILIIGKEQKKKKNINITQIENCSNKEILEYLQNTKLLCIPSFFDSSPNILKEGLMSGCNVIISKNVGSYEFFEKGNIVNDINNVNEWITKIENNIKKKIKLNNFYPELVKRQLICNIVSFSEYFDILNEDMIMESGIGIYKLPAQWNNIKLNDNNSNIIPVKYSNDMNIYDIVQNDIYFKLFIKNDIYNCKYYHYIITNPGSNINKYTNASNIFPYLSNKIYIWEISDYKLLSKFKQAKYYFLRGNYYDIYSQFINDTSKIYLYPATSLIYNNKYELITNRIVNYKFDYVLYDDINNKDNWNEMFPNSKIIKFNKPVSSNVLCYNSQRKYDYIFVATENQITKNRSLFTEFIMFCEKQKIKVSIINVGKLDRKINKLKYVNFLSYDRITYNDIIELFNNSRINLMFSGRDALPRVVTESIACGCFNIALDTISDGKSLYNSTFGVILSFPHLPKEYNDISKSISYKPNDEIFKEILKYKNYSYDHYKISELFLNSMSYEIKLN